MLVAVWDGMYAAIPRLQAEDQLAAYAVAVVATPAHDDAGVQHRQSVLDGWRQQMQGALERVRDTAQHVSLHQLSDMLRSAFGRQVRD